MMTQPAQPAKRLQIGVSVGAKTYVLSLSKREHAALVRAARDAKTNAVGPWVRTVAACVLGVLRIDATDLGAGIELAAHRAEIPPSTWLRFVACAAADESYDLVRVLLAAAGKVGAVPA